MSLYKWGELMFQYLYTQLDGCAESRQEAEATQIQFGQPTSENSQKIYAFFQFPVYFSDYINITILVMLNPDQLLISLPIPTSDSTDSSLMDENDQMTLIFRNKHYTLSKSTLKSFSKLFQKHFPNNLHSYEIKLAFNDVVLANLISVFQGKSVVVDRSEVIQYYQIISFFEADALKDQLLKDINDQFQEYDTFAIMKLAHDHNNNQLFNKCLDELESQSFQQMKYHQLSLLSIDLNLFKFTVKSHNQFKGKTKKGLTYKNISDLIKLYCDSNGLPSQKIEELRLELIQVSTLTAMQFKEIFMDSMLNKISLTRPSKVKSTPQSLDLRFKKKIANFLRNLALGSSSPQLKPTVIKEVKLFIENIYLSKQIQQLQKQYKIMEEQLKQLKVKVPPKKCKTTPLHDQIPEISKQMQESKQKNKLNLILSVMDKMSQEFEEKIEQMSKIVTTYEQKLKDKTQKQINQAQSPASTLSDLSCVVVHKMMTNNNHPYPTPKLPKKASTRFKKLGSFNYIISTEETGSDLNFDNKISYNQVPTAIKSKSLPSLNRIIRPDGFRKINLTLVFRRSQNLASVGQKSDLFNRGHLLILIRTREGTEIGGYISSKLMENQREVEDKNAFIFNIDTHSRFKIGSNFERAIILDEENLFCFEKDLIISNDCLQKKSYYELNSYTKEQSKPDVLEREDLGLPHEFYIQNLQVYETNLGQMQMLI